MSIAIEALPALLDVLDVEGAPGFVILAYADFVRLAAADPSIEAPEVVSVLDHGGEHAFAILRYTAFVAFVRRFAVEGRIDEPRYLAKHPDVRAAVEAGSLPSATHHYVVQGYFERRETYFQRRDPPR